MFICTYKVRALIFIILLFTLTACSTENQPVIKPKVFDGAGILTNDTLRSIENDFIFPPDMPLYIRTIKELPLSEISIIPNKMMENEKYFDEVRYRSWYSSKFAANPSYWTGIYILISEKPRLLQIRFGPQIIMEAYKSGLADGREYINYQKKYITGYKNDVLLEVVGWLQRSMPKALVLPWYMKISKSIIAYGSNEFEEFLYPGNGFYTNYLLKPYLYFSSKILAIYNNPLSIPVIAALLYLIIRIIAIKYILNTILKIFTMQTANAVRSISVIVLSIFLSFPAIGSVIILSNGRVEDAMALTQLGIKLPELIKIHSSMFSIETSIIFALMVAALKFIRDNLNNSSVFFLANLPYEYQVKYYEYSMENNPSNLLLHGVASSSDFVKGDDLDKRPYTELRRYFVGESAISSAKWFAFLLFMPKAISLYVLATFALPLPLGILSLKTAHTKFQKIRSAVKEIEL